jgi:hypothetical protein
MCKTTDFGCWGCGRPFEALRYERMAYAPAEMAFYRGYCDVYTKQSDVPALLCRGVVRMSPSAARHRPNPAGGEKTYGRRLDPYHALGLRSSCR